MLSRSAEKVYWAGRYLERAENTARIVQQYSQLLLDLPDEVGVTWHELAPIFGPDLQAVVDKAQLADSDVDLTNLMLTNDSNGSSLNYSLRMARENIRNARDLLPIESWESVNELYHYARSSLAELSGSEDRFEVLSRCIDHCQQVSGCLNNTMSHRSPYQFLMLGLQVERADMTTRIIDIAASYIQKNELVTQRYGSTLWTNLLKTVGGFQMYRQYAQPQVVGTKVIEFLLKDPDFPRAVHSCVNNAIYTASNLPRNAATIEALSKVAVILTNADVNSFDAQSVSRKMDQIQQELANAHSTIAKTWFPKENS